MRTMKFMEVIGKLAGAFTHKAAPATPQGKLDHLAKHFVYIRDNPDAWLDDIVRGCRDAVEGTTLIDLDLTDQDWDALAAAHPNASKAYEPAADIIRGANVIECFPFIGEFPAWKEAVALYDRIGVRIYLEFESVTGVETGINLNTVSKDEARPLRWALRDLRRLSEGPHGNTTP